MQELISAGADVNTENSNRVTPLIIAAQEGNAKCLENLISADAEINKVTIDLDEKNCLDGSF